MPPLNALPVFFSPFLLYLLSVIGGQRVTFFPRGVLQGGEGGAHGLLEQGYLLPDGGVIGDN